MIIKNRKFLLFLIAGTLTSLPFTAFAGNVKKVYVNVAKEGNKAQTSDIPANYGQIETNMKNRAYGAIYNTHGTIYSADVVSGPSSSFGKALTYKSVNTSYTSAPNVAANTTLGARNTVQFWVKWDGTDYGMPFSWASDYDISLYPSGQNGLVGVNTGCGDSITFPMFANKWTHVTMIMPNGVPNTSTVEAYINGNKVNVSGDSGGHCTKYATSTVYIGKYSYNEPSHVYAIKADIDDVRIWNRVLTADEIKKNYNKELTGGEPGLVGYWNFN